jgi:hypothetical protein
MEVSDQFSRPVRFTPWENSPFPRADWTVGARGSIDGWNQKVAGSSLDEIIGFFFSLGVYSASSSWVPEDIFLG